MEKITRNEFLEKLKIKKEESVNNNREALDYFNLAASSLSENKFKNADFYINEYRSKINYKKFPIFDNRLSGKLLVSVIITSYKTGPDLIKCVESLILNNDEFEIIVVDNGKNDDILEDLLKFNLLYIACPINLFPSEGRNIGANIAKGKIVAFLDDDAIVEKNYVKNIIKAFGNSSILGLRGKVLPKTNHPNNLNIGHYNLGDDEKFIRYINTEGNSAFLRDAYIGINGLNPLLFGHEGIELSYRIEREYGVNNIIYSPNIIIKHDFARTEDKLKIKTERHTLMRKYVQYKHKDIDLFLDDV